MSGTNEKSYKPCAAMGTFCGRKGEPAVHSFSPDGARVVTASDDGLARIWDARVTPVLQQISWIEADGPYVKLHTRDGGEQFHREPMGSLDSALDRRRFVRIHRSAIVNIDLIDELKQDAHGDYVVLLRGGAEIRVGRRFRARLQARRWDWTPRRVPSRAASRTSITRSTRSTTRSLEPKPGRGRASIDVPSDPTTAETPRCPTMTHWSAAAWLRMTGARSSIRATASWLASLPQELP